MRNEAALLAPVLETLSRDFTISTEHRGTTIDGKRVRIDAVLAPWDSSSWKNPNLRLGIEAKDAVELAGDFRNMASWLAQCIDYSYTDWDNIGRMPVFTFPAISEHTNVPQFDVIPHLLGQFNCGEVKMHPRHGISLVMHQTHRIWSQGRGVEEGARWSLAPRIGSGRRQ